MKCMFVLYGFFYLFAFEGAVVDPGFSGVTSPEVRMGVPLSKINSAQVSGRVSRVEGNLFFVEGNLFLPKETFSTAWVRSPKSWARFPMSKETWF
jgi:hypothetical protein